MKKMLSTYSLYIFLIPVFFVLHGYNQNFGLISFKDCFVLLLTYCLATALVYFLAGLLFKVPPKKALLTASLISFYLFFGAMLDFFKGHLVWFSKYIAILPAFIVLICVLVLFLKKASSSFTKLTLFLNTLLLLYVAWDVSGITLKSLHPNDDKLSIYGDEKSNAYHPCSDCKNLDIYFLVFDEYSSSNNLKQVFNYDNSDLDSFLLHQGFSIQASSFSNYNFTPFSMASILNMNYIKGIKNVNACSVEDYANCNNLIRDNEVIKYLSSRQYDIVNYSIFDLAGNPSIIQTSLLPVKTRLITAQTFYPRMMLDIGWNLFTGRFEIKWLSKNLLYENLNNNNKILKLVKEETQLHPASPRFIYAHFEMPHPPFYYDKDLRFRSEEELVAEKTGVHIASYKGYIPYTNNKVKELIETIQKNTDDSAVIVLMGDHGYRVEVNGRSRDHFFKNLNAVYFPGKNYSLLKDSASGVNQFRMVFNSLFKQSLPLLPDTSIFLTDQH
jgi:hypothetical protein